ncbi:hypothetical protein CQW23_12308 [Capsicum baccatum]|uniref:Uncharacterized protein n=1 Tax=Capsicum baccatum TaxID=33114 RepID=A0A2G2WSF2_CAPBA|nr:hypothetical protein CQW23_12308 [Capsicum baccatum]
MQNFIGETSVPIMAILDDNPENQQFANHFLHSSVDKVFLFLNFNTDLDAFKFKYYDLAVSYKGKEANFLLGDVETGTFILRTFHGRHKIFSAICTQPDNLASWLKDCKDRKVKPYLKSQPIPEVNNKPVKDGMENRLPRYLFKVQGFPTLYLRSAIASFPWFDGNRTQEAIIEFIQTNRGTPAPSNFVKSDLTVSEMAQKEPMKDEL